MPRLELMTISEFGEWSRDPEYGGPIRGLYEVNSLPSLPELRKLKLNHCDFFTKPWNEASSEALPRLSRLYTNIASYTGPNLAQVKERCPNLYTLCLFGEKQSRESPTVTAAEHSFVQHIKLYNLSLAYMEAIQITPHSQSFVKVALCPCWWAETSTLAQSISRTLRPLITSEVTKPRVEAENARIEKRMCLLEGGWIAQFGIFDSTLQLSDYGGGMGERKPILFGTYFDYFIYRY
ncbi:hypothetical protein AX16_009854 [Volvariella volvacea WC 439]|nr:hypothetical protein AX16_009854 [Volvariella volvacea WC 439]